MNGAYLTFLSRLFLATEAAENAMGAPYQPNSATACLTADRSAVAHSTVDSSTTTDSVTDVNDTMITNDSTSRMRCCRKQLVNASTGEYSD